jgi:hypothetical protein
MMKYKTDKWIVAAVALSIVLPGCKSIPRDDFTGEHLRVGPITITNSAPIPEVVHRIVESCRKNHPGVLIDCEFVLRDRCVCEKPARTVFREEDALKLTEWGNSSLACVTVPLKNGLRVALPSDLAFAVSGWSQPGGFSVVVGAPELVGSHPLFRRRTYRIPEAYAANFTNLPSLLAPTGASMAYDPSKKWLTIIDNERESLSSEMLDLIGAKRVDNAMQADEL